MNDTMVNESFQANCQRVLQVAKDLYQRNPDWVTFFREVLGVSGAARALFAEEEQYLAFERTPEYQQIQQLVTQLRSRKIAAAGHNEATRVITVRLPESLHEALKAEAADHKTSMNKLCISKLLQVLSETSGSHVRSGKPAMAAGAPRESSAPSSAQPPRPYPSVNSAGPHAPHRSGNHPAGPSGTPSDNHSSESVPASQPSFQPSTAPTAPSVQQTRYGNRF